VVGVAKDSRYLYIGEPSQDFVYVPFRQEPRGNMVLVTQTAGDSAALLAPLREVVQNLDADVPVYDVQTVETFFDARATGIGRVILSMVAAMGLMGVALTMVGLYGLVSYAVSRRTREIGIRIAIGASHERVLRMVLRQGMTPVWFGMFAGIGLSLVTLRVLPRVIALGPHYDSRANFLILPTLLLVTILAVLAPSLRAAGVEPAVALRVD
jgi:ABC-type antimicrobial peptide transport system permease subunit